MDALQFLARCRDLGIDLPVESLDAFDRFEEALYTANRSVNLTRIPRPNCRAYHFLDSLLFHDLIPWGVCILDVGTGPGFPAWPLACARTDLNVTALDSSGRMLSFLRGQGLANLDCVQARVEEWGVRDAFDVVTGRAISPLAIQLELSAAPCKKGGLVLPMRSESDLAEIDRIDPEGLGLRLCRVERRVLPGAEAPRVVPVYEKVEPTPARYPRAWPAIKRSPFGT